IGSGIKTRQVVIFTRQFATMINSGLPLVQSLEILAKQTESKALANVIDQVRYDVEAGNTLADSMRKHPKAFSDLYVNMVAAGEAGGLLDGILLRLVAILLIFVIPTFQAMFESAGVELPVPTQIVISLSEFLQSYWWGVVGIILAIGVALRQVYRTPAGQLAIDKLLLRVPIMGNLLLKAAIARFTRTLGTPLSSGVSILEGPEITARTAGNRVIHDAIMNSRASIAGGDTISEPLRKSGVFPPMVVQMINVGEQTGGLDEMLSKIADFYDEEVDAAVEALLSAMEPIMIVVLGTVVGGMIVAMYLPIFDMINAVQG